MKSHTIAARAQRSIGALPKTLSPAGRGWGEGGWPMSKFARTLRRRSTEAEKLLWSTLRGRQFDGIKFKRQVPIANYVVDFLALDQKFIIEVDGGQHDLRAAKDTERTRILEEWGYHVVRFWNNDVLTNIDGVLESIWQELKLFR
jgi:very-short-patch-repair endonuclease